MGEPDAKAASRQPNDGGGDNGRRVLLWGSRTGGWMNTHTHTHTHRERESVCVCVREREREILISRGEGHVEIC